MLSKEEIINKIVNNNSGQVIVTCKTDDKTFIDKYKVFSREKGKCDNRKKASVQIRTEWAKKLRDKALEFVTCCEIRNF